MNERHFDTLSLCLPYLHAHISVQNGDFGNGWSAVLGGGHQTTTLVVTEHQLLCYGVLILDRASEEQAWIVGRFYFMDICWKATFFGYISLGMLF